jgi:hypothetical protein
MNGDDIDGWLRQAREETAAGHRTEALELFQRSVSAARALPGPIGVRLNYAFTDWAELARGYPPAREALLAVREQAADRLRTGGTEPGGPPGRPGSGPTAMDDFSEVATISTRLDDPGYPVALFAELDEKLPDTAVACAVAARPLLIRAGRFDLARRYLDDPQPVVLRLAALFEQRLTRGFGHLPEQLRERLRQDTVNDYLTDVRGVLTILARTGETELAEQMRRLAVDAVPWAHVRDDVEVALHDDPA